GSPLAVEDLAEHRSDWTEPLRIAYAEGQVASTPPPTQGRSALAVLGMTEGFDMASLLEADYIHLMVEATKLAFEDRDRHLTDPAFMRVPAAELLAPDRLRSRAGLISRERVRRPPPAAPAGGDTLALVTANQEGNAVSLIQSLYFTFGSGLMAGDTGVVLQNRGVFFSLGPGPVYALSPAKVCGCRRPRLGAPEPRRVLPPGPGACQCPGPGQADHAHAHPRDVPRGRPAAFRLRHDGRRGAAADPGRHSHPPALPSVRAAGGDRGAAMALRADVGHRFTRAEPGGPLLDRAGAQPGRPWPRGRDGRGVGGSLRPRPRDLERPGGRLRGRFGPARGRRGAGLLNVAAGQRFVELDADLREIGAGLDGQPRVGPRPDPALQDARFFEPHLA